MANDDMINLFIKLYLSKKIVKIQNHLKLKKTTPKFICNKRKIYYLNFANKL